MKDEKRFYKTKDYLVISVLECLGAKLDCVEWEKNSLFFFFEDYAKCEKIVSDYYTDRLLVNPKDLFNASRNIKSIIHNS